MKTKRLLLTKELYVASIYCLISSFHLVAQPSNDLPCNSTLVEVDGSLNTYSNIDASFDTGEPLPPAGTAFNACFSQDGWCINGLSLENSIWFNFVAPTSGNVTILTCNEGTTVDTQVALYTLDVCDNYSSYNLIAANDDLAGCLQDWASSLTACVVPGNIYYLQIDGYNGDSGDIALSITSGDGSECTDCPTLGADVGDSCDDGDANTINDEISPSCTCEGELAGDASLTGTADWNNSCSSRPMEIAMYNAGTSTLVATHGIDLNSDGTFATSMDYLGTFDIYIKIDGYLRKGFYNYSMGIGENTLDIGELTSGELNGDDGVNIADVSVVNAAFGSEIGDPNYSLLADMNCNDGVNIVDVSILNANFGLVGVILP